MREAHNHAAIGLKNRLFGIREEWIDRCAAAEASPPEQNLDHVIRVALPWIDHYNNSQPHSSLGYLTPGAWRGRDQARITSLSV
jgi:transposase InsO family protein